MNINRPEIKHNLQKTVEYLAGDIGVRSYLHSSALKKSVDYISSSFRNCNYEVHEQEYQARGGKFKNIWVEKKGNGLPEHIIVIGAHYDTVSSTPGADDNASGVAVLLELARMSVSLSLGHTIHLVAFALEEPPFFRTDKMGSHVYADMLKRNNKNVLGMICLESVGFYSDKPESQMFPLPFFRFFYPTTGNYIVFVSNFESKRFMNQALDAFRKSSTVQAEYISTFSAIPGVDFSDHRSFWKHGYNAFMVTDTAFYRNPNYHGEGDQPDTLDYDRMTEVTIGLASSLTTIGNSNVQ